MMFVMFLDEFLKLVRKICYLKLNVKKCAQTELLRASKLIWSFSIMLTNKQTENQYLCPPRFGPTLAKEPEKPTPTTGQPAKELFNYDMS